MDGIKSGALSQAQLCLKFTLLLSELSVHVLLYRFFYLRLMRFSFCVFFNHFSRLRLKVAPFVILAWLLLFCVLPLFFMLCLFIRRWKWFLWRIWHDWIHAKQEFWRCVCGFLENLSKLAETMYNYASYTCHKGRTCFSCCISQESFHITFHGNKTRFVNTTRDQSMRTTESIAKWLTHTDDRFCSIKLHVRGFSTEFRHVWCDK